MALVSALTYTVLDHVGNPRTESWMTLEFSGAYATGGQSIDLSSVFRRIEHIQTFPMSGGELRAPVSAAATFHAASGTQVTVTPVIADYGTPTSARFLIGAPTILSGVGQLQDILSGLAGSISGIRFGARVIGY